MISPLLPLLLSTSYFGDVVRPSTRLVDQDFGLSLDPDRYVVSRYGYYAPSVYYHRPWADSLRSEVADRGITKTVLDKDGFKITLDVQLFKPEEINVKIVDKHIVVEAKHEEKRDEHGLVSRQFVRKFIVPDNIDLELINSTISTDGVLMIQAPVKEIHEDVRSVKIEQTGKPALNDKDEEGKKEETATSTVNPDEESTTVTN